MGYTVLSILVISTCASTVRLFNQDEIDCFKNCNTNLVDCIVKKKNILEILKSCSRGVGRNLFCCTEYLRLLKANEKREEESIMREINALINDVPPNYMQKMGRYGKRGFLKGLFS